MSRPQIVAMGGGVLAPETGVVALERYIADCSQKASPRVLFVPTASGDEPSNIARFYEAYTLAGCRPSHLPFFRRTPTDLRGLVLSYDVVHVGGGNTRSMLAVWCEWGFAEILREAWEAGIVLCGSSAGSICWFEEGVTDSIAGDLSRLGGLGFLRGSNCPHYDGEKERRPAYQRLVESSQMRPGIAADDGVGLHYVGEDLHALVSARPGAAAYRVDRDGEGRVRETRLEAVLLTTKSAG